MPACLSSLSVAQVPPEIGKADPSTAAVSQRDLRKRPRDTDDCESERRDVSGVVRSDENGVLLRRQPVATRDRVCRRLHHREVARRGLLFEPFARVASAMPVACARSDSVTAPFSAMAS
jgi:hypothetical protein